MKPLMDQTVTLHYPDGEKDDYGRQTTRNVESIARVKFSSRTILTASGQQYQTTLEVDLPPETFVVRGTSLSYKSPQNITTKGQVMDLDETTNLMGNVVEYRTVYVG